MAKRKKPETRHRGTRGQNGPGRWVIVKWITRNGVRIGPPAGKSAWRFWIPEDKDRDKK